MIDVRAKLIGGPVYLTGETVECYITFSNPSVPRHLKSHSDSDVLETLAWASVQIHCQCSTNNKEINYTTCSVSAEELSTSNPVTSFAPCRGERGHIVLSTKPRILCSDLTLSIGESKSYVYSEMLPCDAPPSYKGQVVKYSYKITIGMQRINSPIKLLRFPLRVLEADGFIEHDAREDNEDLRPNNPFLEARSKETPLDIAMQIMLNISTQRNRSVYNITNPRGKVVRFCLFKKAYRLGEDIVGTFDFSDATIPCVQFSVVLQSEEEINPGFKKCAKRGPTIVSYSKHHEVCLNMKLSQLILPIPLHVTPTFSTRLVTLRWRLHFEFVTTVTSLTRQTTSNAKGNFVQGHPFLDIETMIWNLPISVYSTTPMQVHSFLPTTFDSTV